MKELKTYIVHLYKSPDCIRGWLAYLKIGCNEATLKVRLRAENGAKAKNKAITEANSGFKNVEIIWANYIDNLWSVNNFPKLKIELSQLGMKGGKG